MSPSQLIPGGSAPYQRRTRQIISREIAMRVLIPSVAFLILIASASRAVEAQDVTPPVAGTIAAVQQQLKQAGYAPGPVNGVMTETTRRAILTYERRTGHPPEALATGGAADPVRRAQEGLQRLGQYAGTVDGALGPQTRDAIIRFEAGRHLPIDPRVSDRLLAELDQAGAATAAASAPPAAPPANPPAAAGPTTAQLPEGQTPEAFGRRQLPAWVDPPPIR